MQTLPTPLSPEKCHIHPLIFFFSLIFKYQEQPWENVGEHENVEVQTGPQTEPCLCSLQTSVFAHLVSFGLGPFANLFTLSSWKKTAKENKNKGFLPRRGKKTVSLTSNNSPSLHTPPLKVRCSLTLKIECVQGPPATPCAWLPQPWGIFIWKGESQLRDGNHFF